MAGWAEAVVIDYVLIKRLAGYFDAEGRLAKWPAKSRLQQICLWVVWSKLPPRESWTSLSLTQGFYGTFIWRPRAVSAARCAIRVWWRGLRMAASIGEWSGGRLQRRSS